MTRLASLLLILPLLAAANDRWIEIRSGPFQVISNDRDRTAREVMNRLEQFRHVFGAVLGKQDPITTWPVRVLLLRKGTPAPPQLSRDTFVGAVASDSPPPPEWLRALAGILLESNATRMPRAIESGLLDFYSTAEVAANVITLGRPPQERTTDWARIHMLQVHPDYYGKLRVLLSNLQQGVDAGPAFRNSFGRSPAEIDQQASAYLAAGAFDTIEISGRPLNATRDFTPVRLEARAAEAALADLALIDPARGAQARAAYEKLLASSPAEAREGLALLALRENRIEDARRELAAAVEAGSTSARAWLEQARLGSDPAGMAAGLRRAAELNPNWAGPHALLARSETDPARKLEALRAAATLEPRNAGYWRALAEEAQAQNQYGDAGRAWMAAENASVDPAEREQVREARRGIEEKRLEFEAAERRRLEEEREREIRRLKDAALAEVRAAEARANVGAPEPPPDREVVQWWDGAVPSGRVRGRIVQIDCLRGVLRLVVETEPGQATRLLIRDPGKVLVMGDGELSLRCGPQASPRLVVVEFFPKDDPKLSSAGEIATVEYLAEPPQQPAPEPRRRLSPVK